MADDLTLFRALVYIGSVLGIAGVLVFVSWILGQKHKEKVTDEPYESGIAPTGSPRVPFNIDFYLVGLLFVIFDLEAAFLFAWAVAARKLGWQGYGAVLVFVAILVVGLIYEWRQGALDFGPPGRRLPRVVSTTPSAGVFGAADGAGVLRSKRSADVYFGAGSGAAARPGDVA